MIPFLKNRVVLALIIVALAQTGVLAGMVIDRARLIKTGREITLPIVPVDPRDLFRGQYVRLGYDISRVPARLTEEPLPAPNAAFFVTLEEQASGVWVPVKLDAIHAAGKFAEPHRSQGRTQGGRLLEGANAPNGANFVRYGIESYFVREGEGPRLEKLARDKKLAARIAVDKSGNAAIKGLLIDGVLQYEEPAVLTRVPEPFASRGTWHEEAEARILYGEKRPDGSTPFWRMPTIWSAADGKPATTVAE
jgi:uncharacterized membrane-anchored protein